MCAMQKILQQSYDLVFSHKPYYKTFYFKIFIHNTYKISCINTWINHICDFSDKHGKKMIPYYV